MAKQETGRVLSKLERIWYLLISHLLFIGRHKMPPEIPDVKLELTEPNSKPLVVKVPKKKTPLRLNNKRTFFDDKEAEEKGQEEEEKAKEVKKTTLQMPATSWVEDISDSSFEQIMSGTTTEKIKVVEAKKKDPKKQKSDPEVDTSSRAWIDSAKFKIDHLERKQKQNSVPKVRKTRRKDNQNSGDEGSPRSVKSPKKKRKVVEKNKLEVTGGAKSKQKITEEAERAEKVLASKNKKSSSKEAEEVDFVKSDIKSDKEEDKVAEDDHGKSDSDSESDDSSEEELKNLLKKNPELKELFL